MRPQEKIKLHTDNRALKLAERLLKRDKKTWSDFIEFSGIERQVVRMWMHGHKNPSINSWNQISLFTNTPIFEFLELTEFNLIKDNDLLESSIPDLIHARNLEDRDIYQMSDITRRTVQKAKKQHYLPKHETILKFKKFFQLGSVSELLKLKK